VSTIKDSVNTKSFLTPITISDITRFTIASKITLILHGFNLRYRAKHSAAMNKAFQIGNRGINDCGRQAKPRVCKGSE
jgi:hypothetical protein